MADQSDQPQLKAQEQAVAVRVTPRGSRNQVLGLRDGAVAIKLQAPPVDGAANAALVAYVGLPE